MEEYGYRRQQILNVLVELREQLLHRHALSVYNMERLRRVCVALDIRANDPFDRVEFRHLTQWLREEYEPLNPAQAVAKDLAELAAQVGRNVFRHRISRLNFFVL